MLIKSGNKIINTDHLVYAEFTEGGEPELNVYMTNIYAGNERRVAVVTFDGDEARAVWGVLRREAEELS